MQTKVTPDKIVSHGALFVCVRGSERSTQDGLGSAGDESLEPLAEAAIKMLEISGAGELRVVVGDRSVLCRSAGHASSVLIAPTASPVIKSAQRWLRKLLRATNATETAPAIPVLSIASEPKIAS